MNTPKQLNDGDRMLLAPILQQGPVLIGREFGTLNRGDRNDSG